MELTLDLPSEPLRGLAPSTEALSQRLKLELACTLYSGGHLSLAQAAQTAELHPHTFGIELGRREIPRQIDEEHLDQDFTFADRYAEAQ